MRASALFVVRTVTCAALALLPTLPAAASPPRAESPAGKKLCAITDQRLAEISGLVATENGYLAVPDGTAGEQDLGAQALQVFQLNRSCQVTQRHSFRRDPFDPEDLAITKDGTLWIADTGDNAQERERGIVLWKIPPDRSKASLYRFKYPKARMDAEALVMQPNGMPVIITKDLDGLGVAQIYTPTAAPKPDQTVPLKQVGEIKLTFTGTGGGPIGAIGQKIVTGAALSADGSRVVVRTYTDAYEWQVSGGNVVAALNKGKPIRTPLPREPQGEAITYSLDGKYFITASEATRTTGPARLYRYVPHKVSPTKQPMPLKGAQSGWLDGLRLQDIKLIIGAAGAVGLLLLVAGILGIRRARRDMSDEEEDDGAGHPGGANGWLDGPSRDRDDPRRRDNRMRHEPAQAGHTGHGDRRYTGQQYGTDPWRPPGADPAGRESGRTAGRAYGGAAGPVGARGDRAGGAATQWGGGSPRPSRRSRSDSSYPPQQPSAGDYWSR